MPDIEKLRKNLEAEGFQTSYFPTTEAACDYLDKELDGRTIGLGGTMTVVEMGLYPRLAAHNTCRWHWDGATLEDAAHTQVYISSVNGVAETGELINIDGCGNRLASGLFGHEKAYLIIGINKIAPDYDAALWRARNVAAPKNAQRLHKKTPCALKGDKCYNCSSPERICRALLVYWEKPTAIPEMEIVIVGQSLGY